MYRNYFRPLGLLALTVVLWVLLTIEGLFFPVRLLASLLFICFLPGYAMVSVLFRRDALDLTDHAAFVLSFSLGITIVGGIVMNLTPLGLSESSWRLWLAGFTILMLSISLLRVESAADDYAGAERRPHNLSTSQLMIFAAAIVIFGMSLVIAYEGDRSRPKDEFSQIWLLWHDEAQGLVNMGLSNLEDGTREYRLVLFSDNAIIHEWDIVLEASESWQVRYPIPRHFLQTTEIRMVLYQAGSEEAYRNAVLRVGR